MVGVPGRSKGCKTCRKRKKGCDLKRPECGQCTDRGLVCGGYDRDRVFVTQNPGGSPTSVGAVSQYKKQERIQPKVLGLSSGYSPQDNDFTQLVLQDPSTPGGTIVLPQSLARSAYCEKNVELYLSVYLPSDEPSRSKVTRMGLPIILNGLYREDEALRMSMLAVATAATGQANGDRALMEQGKRLYGWSLCELTKALANDRRAKSDALLAVPRVMGLFEILFGWDLDLKLQAQSWQSHAAGDLALMRAKGPKAFREGTAHQLFVDGRLSPIIAATGIRKACVLNSPEWKTIPWESQPKSPKDGIIDVLAEMPGLLEEFDILMTNENNERDIRAQDVWNRSQEIERELKQWLSFNRHLVLEPETEDPIPLEFPDLATAHLTVLYWTTRLLLHQVTHNVSPLIASPASFLLPDRQPFKKHSRFYARRIARSISYFFRPSSGIWGPVMVAFPLGHALLSLRIKSLKEDDPYKMLVFRSWSDPNLPSAIKSFLISMRKQMEERRSTKWVHLLD